MQLIERSIRVYRSEWLRYLEATVEDYDPSTRRHTIRYTEGGGGEEEVDLEQEKWQLWVDEAAFKIEKKAKSITTDEIKPRAHEIKGLGNREDLEVVEVTVPEPCVPQIIGFHGELRTAVIVQQGLENLTFSRLNKFVFLAKIEGPKDKVRAFQQNLKNKIRMYGKQYAELKAARAAAHVREVKKSEAEIKAERMKAQEKERSDYISKVQESLLNFAGKLCYGFDWIFPNWKVREAFPGDDTSLNNIRVIIKLIEDTCASLRSPSPPKMRLHACVLFFRYMVMKPQDTNTLKETALACVFIAYKIFQPWKGKSIPDFFLVSYSKRFPGHPPDFFIYKQKGGRSLNNEGQRWEDKILAAEQKILTALRFDVYFPDIYEIASRAVELKELPDTDALGLLEEIFEKTCYQPLLWLQRDPLVIALAAVTVARAFTQLKRSGCTDMSEGQDFYTARARGILAELKFVPTSELKRRVLGSSTNDFFEAMRYLFQVQAGDSGLFHAQLVVSSFTQAPPHAFNGPCSLSASVIPYIPQLNTKDLETDESKMKLKLKEMIVKKDIPELRRLRLDPLFKGQVHLMRWPSEKVRARECLVSPPPCTEDRYLLHACAPFLL